MASKVDTHGFDTLIPGNAGAPGVPAFAALPEKARRGMVVLHEAFGRQPEIDRVVLRFARAGYAAVAPDLLTAGLRMVCLRRAVQAIATGQGPQIEAIRGTRHWLCQKTGLAKQKIGLIGFCLGGGFALAAGRGWGAVSTNYGDIPPEQVLAGIGPVIGCYGGRDRIFGQNGAKLVRAMGRIGSEVEVYTFPTAGHSFLTDGEHPVAFGISAPMLRTGHEPESARDAWAKILAFFDRHLGDPPANDPETPDA